MKAKFKDAAAAMKLGYGLDEETELGPLTTSAGKEKVMAWIENWLAEGAKMVLTAEQPEWKAIPMATFWGPPYLKMSM